MDFQGTNKSAYILKIFNYKISFTLILASPFYSSIPPTWFVFHATDPSARIHVILFIIQIVLKDFLQAGLNSSACQLHAIHLEWDEIVLISGFLWERLRNRIRSQALNYLPEEKTAFSLKNNKKKKKEWKEFQPWRANPKGSANSFDSSSVFSFFSSKIVSKRVNNPISGFALFFLSLRFDECNSHNCQQWRYYFSPFIWEFRIEM